MYDAVIIGAGPNGLSAAIALARQGCSVAIFEAAETVGGGTRTKELTLPGFRHDVCSAIHPMAVGSPFFKTLPLEKYGLEWCYPPYPLAHPMDDGPAVVMHESIEETARELGVDGPAYTKLMRPFVEHWDALADEILGPLNSLPTHPFLMARFGLKAIQSAKGLARRRFSGARARALFAGLAAHSVLPLEAVSTAAIGMVLGIIGHKIGWPTPRGGSAAITDALAAYFTDLGGDIVTHHPVKTLADVPEARVVLFGNTPRQILSIAGERLPTRYAQKLQSFEYGAGVFKMDLALNGPVPWHDDRCQHAGTLHLGASLEEIAASEKACNNGQHADNPYVLVTQQSMFDDSRAPDGHHTLWAYCHVPNGSERDMSEPILKQIARFAPGIRDCIIGTHTMTTRAMQQYNANYVGGDINGGKQDISQLFTRPAGLLDPYHIPNSNLFIASSSTPPGGGVHGMCGYHAAQSALRYLG